MSSQEMSRVSNKSMFERIRRALYKTQRTMGDVEAAERGPDVLAKRLIRRHVTRHVGRYYNRLWRKI